MNPRFKSNTKKNHLFELSAHEKPEVMLQEATDFLQTLENLRQELITRDAAYVAAKKSGDKEQMEQYRQLSSTMSQKCLDYSRDLCDAAIPHWVDGNLPKEKVGLAKHAYDVIRNKMCASLDVFDNDLLPNAHALITFAEGRF
ncbi:MAG: hypothetical protein PHN45_00985 [Methylococcales bacterium]|nr:hypothetical protein [Methylococcales bacterium]MDD5753314.1 hypothetical protein [Methylococcales bacterium]